VPVGSVQDPHEKTTNSLGLEIWGQKNNLAKYRAKKNFRPNILRPLIFLTISGWSEFESTNITILFQGKQPLHENLFLVFLSVGRYSRNFFFYQPI
jgi:hypothetical protein